MDVLKSEARNLTSLFFNGFCLFLSTRVNKTTLVGFTILNPKNRILFGIDGTKLKSGKIWILMNLF